MDYFETLRNDGWLADPGDRVQVVAIHGEECPASRGRSCRCEPRLVLSSDRRPDTRNRAAIETEHFEAASGQ